MREQVAEPPAGLVRPSPFAISEYHNIGAVVLQPGSLPLTFALSIHDDKVADEMLPEAEGYTLKLIRFKCREAVTL